MEEKSLPKMQAPHQKLLTNLLSLSTKGQNKISQQNIKIKISLQVKNQNLQTTSKKGPTYKNTQNQDEWETTPICLNKEESKNEVKMQNLPKQKSKDHNYQQSADAHTYIYIPKCIQMYKINNVVTKFDHKGRWGFLNITALIWIFFHGQLLEASLEKKLI